MNTDPIMYKSTSKELASIIKQRLANAGGYKDDEAQTNRKQADDYYFQRKRKDDKKGRANVVSGSLSAMEEAMTAQMMEAFTADGGIATFDPKNRADEEQSKLESHVIETLLMKRHNGFLKLVSAMKEALRYRNSCMSVEVVDTVVHRVRSMGNVEPDALSELLDDERIIDHEYDEERRELSITRLHNTRKLVLDSVSLEDYVYDKNWYSPDIAGIGFCGERMITTRAEMVSLGLDKDAVYNLPRYSGTSRTDEHSRNPSTASDDANATDKSQELIEWYKLYVRLQAQDGADVLRKIYFHDQSAEILKNVAVSAVRLVTGAVILNPHRWRGVSLFDKLKQNCDKDTGLWRGLFDNVNAVNKTRLAGLENVVIEDDVNDSRVNKMVNVKRTVQDIRQAVMPITVQDTTQSILSNIEAVKRERSEMGGAALDMQTATMQVGGDRMGSEGLDRIYSVAEALSAGMMKIFAATQIRGIFLLAHALVREFFTEPFEYKRDGRWVTVNPSEWPEREEVTIKPGMSPADRRELIEAQGEVVRTNQELAREGMDDISVNLGTHYEALMEYFRLRRVPYPEQYFLDPESDLVKAELEKRNARQAQERKDRYALMQNTLGMRQIELGLDKYKSDADRVLEYAKMLIGSEVEEAKVVGSAIVDLLSNQGVISDSINGRADSRTDQGTSESP